MEVPEIQFTEEFEKTKAILQDRKQIDWDEEPELRKLVLGLTLFAHQSNCTYTTCSQFKLSIIDWNTQTLINHAEIKNDHWVTFSAGQRVGSVECTRCDNDLCERAFDTDFYLNFNAYSQLRTINSALVHLDF